MPSVDDQVIVCRDCAKPFVFSAGEAEYFAMRELSPPKRCPVCRKARRATEFGSGGKQ